MRSGKYCYAALVLVVAVTPGCAIQALSGMTVSLRGDVIDGSTGAPITDVSVMLGVNDHKFVARELAPVSATDEAGAIQHDEFVGWCRRVGPLERIRYNPERDKCLVTLTHPAYQPQTFEYTFEEVWQQDPPRAFIDLGTAALVPLK